ncbi:pyridoxal phosphate-dependent decarboxylase family protein [Virgisporangium aurantiacum]|nr:pyridoxal-dependent decarboxylase [Virgisporangium aurantiacum]
MVEFSASAMADEHADLGAAMTGMISDYVRGLDEAPVCPPATPAELTTLLGAAMPVEGSDPMDVLDALRRKVVPHAMTISSPRYFGLFNPAPLPVAVWVDALCAALNQNGAAWRQSPSVSALESVVLGWLGEVIGQPEGGFGTLTSGGSEANLIALKCARDRAVRRAAHAGLAGSGAPIRVYASEQGHYSLRRGVDILGIGRDNLHTVDTDTSFRIRLDELRAAIEADLARGHRPAAIVGIAGSTSTGAIDPLDGLADLAAEYGLWYHVDAAYGGALAFSAMHGALLHGIERADSVTLDPHKWLFVPFSCGALLTRHGRAGLRSAFDCTPEYLDERRDDDDGGLDFFRYGQLGTRRGNALKLSAALSRLGRRGYAEIIDRQVSLTRRLATRLSAMADFEVLGAVQTAVCCARFLPGRLRDAPGPVQDELQQRLQQRIERGGRAWLATTVLDGRRVLRINVNSVLTRAEHIDELLVLLQEEGTAAHASDIGFAG